MRAMLDANEVARHNSSQSCWVILYGKVYDVTAFLQDHPGGSKIILSLAGRDATEDYDPVHPPGTLESALPESACLGAIDPSTLSQAPVTDSKTEKARDEIREAEGPPPLENLLNLEEFEHHAKRLLSQKAWAYYSSAADDLASKRLNTLAYRSIILRPRVLADVAQVDTSVSVLGYRMKLPLMISPAAMARLAHPRGENGLAEAARKFGIIQIISNNASMTPEQIIENSHLDNQQFYGFQLYVNVDAKKSEDMLKRINPLVKFIALTLDAPTPGKREDDERAKNLGTGGMSSAASGNADAGGGLGRSLFAGTSPSLTWKQTLPWLRKHTPHPIILKGVQTHEDAYLAASDFARANGVRGIILSNHGGRSLDTAPPAVHTLMEIRKYCPEVFDKIEVWVDGGIKRGTDVLKAIALGAKACGLGRAALYGLGVGGVEGVERVLAILTEEIETGMRLLGVNSLMDLGPQHVNTRALEQVIYKGPARLESLDVKARRLPAVDMTMAKAKL